MRVLRAADHKRMPWKNGGGETTEIAVFPEGAGLDDFDWRVSMARVDGDGPFSGFPGIDRTLAILEGAGIVLHLEGQAPQRLTQESRPYSFAADITTSATLLDGPILDLNVMSRRGKTEHEVGSLEGALSLDDMELCIVLCVSGEAEMRTTTETIALSRFDATLVTGPAELKVNGSPGARLFKIICREIELE